jgi:hypothetical protein
LKRRRICELAAVHRLMKIQGFPLVSGATAVVLAISALAIAACASLPAYRQKGSHDSFGYADEQLAPKRFRISYAGSSDVTRTRVEDFLLRRAAEVTVGAGYSFFVFDNRTTETTTQLRTRDEGFSADTGLSFSYGRLFNRRTDYFENWMVPAVASEDSVAQSRYTAASDIMVLTVEEAGRTPAALSARAILDRLAPQAAASEPAGTAP